MITILHVSRTSEGLYIFRDEGGVLPEEIDRDTMLDMVAEWLDIQVNIDRE